MASSSRCGSSTFCAVLDASFYVGETSDSCSACAITIEGCAVRSYGGSSASADRCTRRSLHRGRGLQRERQLKRWSRAKKEALIVGDLAALNKL